MAYKIAFAEKAEKEFSGLDTSIKMQIGKFLDKLAQRENPRTVGEPLEENLSAFWKYRIGDYRLVAEIHDDILVVMILVAAHRREVYKIAGKRLG